MARKPTHGEEGWDALLGTDGSTTGFLDVALNNDGSLKDHASSHQNAGGDPLNLTNLAGFDGNPDHFLNGAGAFSTISGNAGILLNTMIGLSPAAVYPHDDTVFSTMRDASGNSRTGAYGANAKLNAVGMGDDRLNRTAFKTGSTLASSLGLPPAGTIWKSNTWTVCFAMRAWGFDEVGQVWNADTNGVFNTPSIRLTNGTGNSYRVNICRRGGDQLNAAKARGDIKDTYKWHLVICRVNNLTAGSIVVDNDDLTPDSWTNQTYTYASSAQPTIGEQYARVVMQNTAFWPSYITDDDCQDLYDAFVLENTVNQYSRTAFFFGTHTNLDDQNDSGIRANQTRVAMRDGANVTRGDFYVDQWNTSAGVYDFTRADAIFADCANKGLRVWVLMHGSAGYMNSSAGRFAVPGTGLASPFLTWVTQQQTAWSAFATRYKAGGTGNPDGLTPIYEFWNEPNAIAEWKTQTGGSGPDATQWARWCRDVRTSVIAADPLATCIAGGVHSWQAPGVGDIDGETFWRTALATGDLDDFDKLGFHPYPSSQADVDDNTNYSNSFNDFLSALDVLGELGYTDKEVWITEVGWNASSSEAEQNRNTKNALLRWANRWRVYSPSYIQWPDWGSGDDGLYTTMPDDGSDPAPRLVASTMAQMMWLINGSEVA